MSETRTYDIGDPAWVRAAYSGLYDALMARYRDLRDQYEQETKGYSWSGWTKGWMSPAGESIDTVNSKYPYVVRRPLGRISYSHERFDRISELVDKATVTIGGRGGICTIEGGSDPTGSRIRMVLDDGDRITLGLTEIRPYRLRRIKYRYEQAEQTGGSCEKQ